MYKSYLLSPLQQCTKNCYVILHIYRSLSNEDFKNIVLKNTVNKDYRLKGWISFRITVCFVTGRKGILDKYS